MGLCLLVLICLLAPAARADVIPSDANWLKFAGDQNEFIYYTILYQPTPGYDVGQSMSFEEYVEYYDNYPFQYKLDAPPREDIWNRFQDYWDPEGFRCVGPLISSINVGQSDYIAPSGEWATQPFKILCYFVDTDTFGVSGICCPSGNGNDRYTVYLSGNQVTVTEATGGRYVALDVAGLLFRIAVTVVLELLVALLLGFRGRKTVLVLIFTNVVTQLLLNLVLCGMPVPRWLPRYWRIALCEVLIFLVEGECCTWALRRTKLSPSRRECYRCSLAANLVSFSVGLILSNLLPRLF